MLGVLETRSCSESNIVLRSSRSNVISCKPDFITVVFFFSERESLLNTTTFKLRVLGLHKNLTKCLVRAYYLMPANEPHKATKLEQINKMSSRPRVLSSEELSLSSSKTHRRTSSVILDGTVHSESRCDLPDTEQRVRPRADTTSSLRTLELIRQLSFDTITPKIIDISDSILYDEMKA